MQCNTPGLCLIRARGTAARIIRHRRRNNFDKSEYGSAIREFPARGSGKEGLPRGRNSFSIMRVKFQYSPFISKMFWQCVLISIDIV